MDVKVGKPPQKVPPLVDIESKTYSIELSCRYLIVTHDDMSRRRLLPGGHVQRHRYT